MRVSQCAPVCILTNNYLSAEVVMGAQVPKCNMVFISYSISYIGGKLEPHYIITRHSLGHDCLGRDRDRR